MSKYISNLNNDRQFSAVLGVNKKDFEKLLPVFSSVLGEAECQKKRNQKNLRELKDPSDNLIFILFYMKNYPTYDVMGFNFNMGKSTAESYVKKLTPILQEAQIRLKVLPKSKIDSPEILEQLVENNTVLIDATERLHYRHTDYETQKIFYSGKQHQHNLKNTIISTELKKIIYVGDTMPGSIHDYKMFKSEFHSDKNWFKNITAMVDLGYQGIKKDYTFESNIYIPHKKPRKSQKNINPKLTKEQKIYNKKISKKRIFVENAIGGIKRFQILVNRLRSKSNFLKDVFIRLAAGLFNLKNNFVIQ